jgi:hypothetical protein
MLADVYNRHGFNRLRSRVIHHQGWRVQGRDPKAQTADILSQETGAHFSLPAWK